MPRLRRWIENPKFIYWVLGAQLFVLFLHSTLLVSNWQIRKDYAIRYQGIAQAARGVFGAEGSLTPWGFLNDHFEIINYLLVPFIKVPMHLAFPFYLQDLFIVLGEWASVSLLYLLLRRLGSLTESEIRIAVGVTVVVQVFSPWVYMVASDDVHFFSVGALASALAALVRLLQGHRRSASIWLLVAFACGDGAVLYVVGAALTYLIITRKNFKLPITVIVAATAWLVVSSKIGLSSGSGFAAHFSEIVDHPGRTTGGFDVLVSAVRHPMRPIEQIASHWKSLWGFVGAGGVIGLLTPVSFLVWINLAITGMATEGQIAATPWENPAPIFLLASCSCYVIFYVARRLKSPNTRSTFQKAGLTLLLLNTLVWFALWAPYSWHTSFLTSQATIAELNRIESRIHSDSEVIVSQGISGHFASRDWLYLTTLSQFPIKTKTVEVVIIPYQGLESKPTAQETYLLFQLAQLPFSQLRSHDAGVWWFTLRPPVGMKTLDFESNVVASPGWAMLTSIGHVAYSQTGLPEAMEADGSKGGYLTYGAVWGLNNGRWIANVDIDANTSFYVEVGDFSQNRLFARNHFVPTSSRVRLSIPFEVSVSPWASEGWGPFSYLAAPPRFPANIEVRIFAELGGRSILYSIDVPGAPVLK